MYFLNGVSTAIVLEKAVAQLYPNLLELHTYVRTLIRESNTVSWTQKMKCIFHDLPLSPKRKAFVLILLSSSIINFFRLGKQK